MNANEPKTQKPEMKKPKNYSAATTWFQPKLALGFCALALAATPLELSAQTSIGVNFAGRQWSIGGNNPQNVGSSDIAGAVAQANWNNVDLGGHDFGGLAQISGPNPGVISDNFGAATSLTFSYSAQGMWAMNQSTSLTGNQQLMNGYSDVEGSDANIGAYILGNISFSLYDVYVYVTADNNGRVAGVNLNGGAQTYLLTAANGYDFSNPLIEGTATTQGAAASGHYVLFHNVTGSSVEFDLHRYGSNVGLAGFQIVSVPEPSVMALSLTGVALVGLIRRRNRSK